MKNKASRLIGRRLFVSISPLHLNRSFSVASAYALMSSLTSIQSPHSSVDVPPRPPVPPSEGCFAPYSDWFGTGDNRSYSVQPFCSLRDENGRIIGQVNLTAETVPSNCKEDPTHVELSLSTVSVDTGTPLPPTLTAECLNPEEVDIMTTIFRDWLERALLQGFKGFEEKNSNPDRALWYGVLMAYMQDADLAEGERSKGIAERTELVRERLEKSEHAKLKEGWKVVDERLQNLYSDLLAESMERGKHKESSK